MKEKELETINDELFGSFDPNDETWMIGGSRTITGGVTYTPEGMDTWHDMDFPVLEQAGV